MPITKKTERLSIEQFSGRTRQIIVNEKQGAQSSFLHENILPPESIVTSHAHKCEELIVCLEGEIEIEIKGVHSLIKEGDTVIIPPKILHSLRNTSSCSSKILCFFPTLYPYI